MTHDPTSLPPSRAGLASPAEAGGERASDRIRGRLKAAGRRFHANDNIAEFIAEGELDAIQAEVAEAMREVLHALVIDVDSDHNTADTARRVAKMFVR